MQLRQGLKVILLPRNKWKTEDRTRDAYPFYASNENEIFGLGKVCKIKNLENSIYYIKGNPATRFFSFRLEHQKKKSPHLIWEFMVEIIDDL